MLISFVIACAQPPVTTTPGDETLPFHLARPSILQEPAPAERLDPVASDRAFAEADTGELLDTGDTGEELLPWFLDADADGFGAGTAVWDVVAPAGYVAIDGDCDDDDDRARPDQTQAFDTPRTDGQWDFDCDGVVQVGWRQAGVCDADCVVEVQGWATVDPPLCGESAGWIDSCSDEHAEVCEPIVEAERVQTCR